MHKMHHRCDDFNVPYIINQNRYSILDRTVETNGLKEQSEKKKKGIIAFSPLAQGRLSDKYKNGVPKDSRFGRKGQSLDEKELKQIAALAELANERGETLSQMAIQWLLQQGVTSVLIGVRNKKQLLENLDALNKAPITEAEMIKIDTILI